MAHSFGCRLMLEALQVAKGSWKASTLTLIQPAVSRWVFSPHSGRGSEPGMFSDVIATKVISPILVLCSEHDLVLTEIYPVIVGAEVKTNPKYRGRIGDALQPFSLSPHAALGAYGPVNDLTKGGSVMFECDLKYPKPPNGDAVRAVGVKGEWGHAWKKGWAVKKVARVVSRLLLTGAIWD